MTALIDTIEQAFVHHRDRVIAMGEGAILCTPVVEAIEVHCKITDDQLGTLERVVAEAYIAEQRRWGNDWPWESADVAELIFVGLCELIAAP